MKSVFFLLFLISTSLYSKDYLPRQSDFYSAINVPYVCKENDEVSIFIEDRSQWPQEELVKFMKASARSVLPLAWGDFDIVATEKGYTTGVDDRSNVVNFNKNGDVLTFVEDFDVDWFFYSSCLEK